MTPTLHVELQLLSECLTNPGAARQVANVIHKADTFSTPHNRKTYQVMLNLVSNNLETDLISVHNDLQSAHGFLEGDATGWMEFLTGLLPESENFTGNIEKSCYYLINESARRVQMGLYSRALADLQVPGSDPLTLMSNVKKQMEAIEGRLSELNEAPFADALHEAVDMAEQAAKTQNPITGIPTGIYGLDMVLKGLHPATLTVMGARPGQGKTAELCQIAYNVAYNDNTPVAIFSLEMKQIQLARRFLSRDTGMKNAQVLSGLDSFNEPVSIMRLRDSAGRLSGAPLHVYDNVFSLDHICAKSTQLVLSHGVKAIFVDYLQLVETEDRDDRARVSRVSRKLKKLSNDLNVPVVALAQLSRDLEKRASKRPMPSDLRDSGTIEQDADNIVFLYCPSYYASHDDNDYPIDPELLYNIVAKNRNGSTHNDEEGIQLRYDKATNKITMYS